MTGETPVEPVISAKSGAVFERAAIEKYLAGNDTDPTNDQPLTAEDLIAVKNGAPPRPPLRMASLPRRLPLTPCFIFPSGANFQPRSMCAPVRQTQPAPLRC